MTLNHHHHRNRQRMTTMMIQATRMRLTLITVFSLYLLVGAFYNLYGNSDSDPNTREVILRAVWHTSRELYTVFLTYLLFVMTFDTKTKVIALVSMFYLIFKTVFHALNILGIASVKSELWSGFSFLAIFVLALILIDNE